MNWKSASANAARTDNRRTGIALIVILAVALALRLGWVLIIDPAPSFQQLAGGDGQLYLNLGWTLAVRSPWLCYAASGGRAAGPIYPFYLSLFFHGPPAHVTEECKADYGLPDPQAGTDNVIFGARVGQAVIDALMCAAAYDVARRLFGGRVGILAALMLAIDLRFVVQAADINTETLFIFFLVAGVWMYIVARTMSRGRWFAYAAGTAFLLLAAFTRPVAAPLLALFAGSLLLPKPTRTQLATASAVVLLALSVVAVWSWQQYLKTGLLLPISDGLAGNFWLGSRGDGQWHGMAEFELERQELHERHGGRDAYVEDALQTIASDPLAYGRLLIAKLAQAYLQPHGTVAFPGESLKELAIGVLRGQISPIDLLTGEAFWPKLYIYVLHFTGLVGGLIGIWLSRREWLKVLPLYLPIAYFTGAYTLLTIIPRYIFPIMPFYTILAAYAGVTLTDLWATRRTARAG